MKLEELFRECIVRVRDEGALFAVCGGIAAMIYRAETRFTGDIDILISADGREVEIANRVIESFGYRPTPLRTAQLTSSPASRERTSPIEVILGRDAGNKDAFGIDFLLPRQGWSKNALARAQLNLLQVNGLEAPFITADDMLLSKLTSAMQGGSRRLKDADDIQSMLNSGRTFDMAYVAGEVDRLKLTASPELEKSLPHALSVVVKRNRLSKKRRHGREQ